MAALSYAGVEICHEVSQAFVVLLFVACLNSCMYGVRKMDYNYGHVFIS